MRITSAKTFTVGNPWKHWVAWLRRNPLWFEEPVPYQDPDSVVEVALHSPVPIATGESFASPKNFAALLRRGGVRIWQPDPMHLRGLWPTRSVIAMADASDIAGRAAIDLDWERLAERPARRGNRIRLFERGWELRRSVDD